MGSPRRGPSHGVSTRRLPAEWEPQSAVMLTWPHAGTDWIDQLAAVEAVYMDIATRIAVYEPVLIVCNDAASCSDVGERLLAAGVRADRLRLVQAPSDDTWTRDHGPLTIIDADHRIRLIDFRFNGWGGKFTAEQDDRITAQVHAAGGFGDVPLESSRLVLEGGAIETDGLGTALIVRRTLIDPARNPAWDQQAVTAELGDRLGLTRIHWLEHGWLSGDDTDGHIDTLARFCDPETIVHAVCPDPADPDQAALEQLAVELRALRRPDGRPYRLVPLRQPAPIHDETGQRLPAGYANFLIINGAILLPVYQDPADALAIATLGRLFSDRRIEPVDCRALIHQGGSLHCISMQLAAAPG
jgi:agmatine/peptidylarginine deiminase